MEKPFCWEEIAVLQTSIDDMNPEIYPHVMERLLAGGALDVYLQPLIMKKGRPGTLLTVLVKNNQQDVERALHEIFRETSTLGVRMRVERRACLARTIFTVQTEYGPVRVKAAFTEPNRPRYSPEFADCRARSAERSVPLQEVYQAALRAAEKAAPPHPEPPGHTD